MARAAELGGAAAIRAQGLADIAAIKGRVEIPLIGLWKEGHEGVFITPTVRHALACVNAGSDIVAVDATNRPRPDRSTFKDAVEAVHEVGALIMADCGSTEDARAAVMAGADVIGTTLAGYTGDRPKTDGPDLELVSALAEEFPGVPLFCEGRIHTPEQAALALANGACAVVVGTAITHPTSVTSWFVEAVEHGED